MSEKLQDDISLSDINHFFSNQAKKIKNLFFSFFKFFINNIYILSFLFITGVVLGFFADKNKKYEQQIIVIPNFSSVDYLYEKVDVFNSKINEKDSLFLKKYDLKGFKNISKIEINPIIDIYKLAQSSNSNLEMIKLMTEDISMNEIIEGGINKKAYLYHLITIQTNKKSDYEDVIKPFLDYLNDSDYFKAIQKEAVNNVQFRIQENDSTLVQINGILNNFSNLTNQSEKKDNLIYYNENTQINELFKTKEKITVDKGVLISNLITYEKVIRDIGVIENKQVKNKIPNKIIYPVLLILLYVITSYFFKNWKAFKSSINSK